MEDSIEVLADFDRFSLSQSFEQKLNQNWRLVNINLIVLSKEELDNNNVFYRILTNVFLIFLRLILSILQKLLVLKLHIALQELMLEVGMQDMVILNWSEYVLHLDLFRVLTRIFTLKLLKLILRVLMSKGKLIILFFLSEIGFDHLLDDGGEIRMGGWGVTEFQSKVILMQNKQALNLILGWLLILIKPILNQNHLNLQPDQYFL